MPPSNTLDSVAVVGHTGLIGRHVTTLLRERGYDVIGATPTTSPAVDLDSPASIEALLDAHPIRHLVITAGDARFAAFADLDAATFEVGLRNKLMGQVLVALTALRRLPDGGSVTVTTGALSHSPIEGSAPVALVNGALESFVRAVALEAPAGRRIHAVSPGWIRETRERMGLDPAGAASAAEVAALYLHAIERGTNGAIIEAAPRSPVQVTGVDHVVLRVHDLPGMIRFYEDVLGLRLERGPGAAGLAQLRAGAALLDLVDANGPIGRRGSGVGAPGAPSSLDHFCLRVEPWDPVAIRAHLSAQGVDAGPVASRYGAEGQGPSMYLTDPEGNGIELKGPPAQSHQKDQRRPGTTRAPQPSCARALS